MNDTTDIQLLKVQIQAELQRLEAQSSAKDVAGKAIGKDGLKYITAIVVIGVVSSLALDSDKIAAVMGLLGASLTALISKLDRLDRQEQPMRVDVDGDHVTVTKGDDVVKAKRV